MVVMTQIFILCMLIRDADHPRCLDNGDCPSGMFCGGYGAGSNAADTAKIGGAGNSGACFDCYFVLNNATWMETHLSHEIATDKQYCLSSETQGFNLACDYIDENQQMVTLTSALALLFVAVMATLPIAQDQDDVVTDTKVLAARLPKIPEKWHQLWVFFWFWWVILIRLLHVYLLCIYLVAACQPWHILTESTMNYQVGNAHPALAPPRSHDGGCPGTNLDKPTQPRPAAPQRHRHLLHHGRGQPDLGLSQAFGTGEMHSHHGSD